jgi:hypothetical protein
MQRQHKWSNWPVLLMGIFLVTGLICLADFVLSSHKAVQTYILDLAGAISAVIISIATYDEWERRRERERYLPPEKMGVARIQEEIYQLLYQYAFVLNLRFNPSSKAMRTVQRVAHQKEFDKPEAELKAKAAKHISQADKSVSNNLFQLSAQALRKPSLAEQTFADANQLLLQTERALQQLDLAISTYGYSFTPEVHKWALDVREMTSQAITGKIPVLSIRLAASSKIAGNKLDKLASSGLQEIVDELIKAGRKAKRVKLEE